MTKDVHILLVGEHGVGKTSLILALVSEEFPEEVPARAEEITIPADVTPERVPTHIIDYCAYEQDEHRLIEEINKANVICVVYSVEDFASVEKVDTYWLPLVRQVVPDEYRKPVILVGNKSDVLESSSMDVVMPIMNRFAEIETCVECSAKTLKNISEVFYYAQKAVLHPTAPLYLPEDKELTPKCKLALKWIFKICDQDNDGIMNDHEIYQFQRQCFNVPLQPQALEDVKSVVRRQIADGIERDGITEKGFLFLHSLFIQRGRHETTWSVLRKFGYDDNLQLRRDFTCPALKVSRGCTTELTHQGYQFFSSLFDKYDEDNDGYLSPTEMTNLFSACPVMPWGAEISNAVVTNAHGWMTRHGFLAQWTLTTLIDVKKTLEYLAYLGYMYEHDNQLSAIHVTREKKADLERKQSARCVFECRVFGQRGVGKSVFLQGLLGRNLQYLKTLNREQLSPYTINLVRVRGQERYLVLREMDVDISSKLANCDMFCDVICLLYDVTNPHTFEYCAQLYMQNFSQSALPVLIVGCKAEHHAVWQETELQPVEFCKEFGLPPPQMLSCMDRINRDIYVKIAMMALCPRDKYQMFQSRSGVWMKAGIGLAIVTTLGLLLLRYLRTRT